MSKFKFIYILIYFRQRKKDISNYMRIFELAHGKSELSENDNLENSNNYIIFNIINFLFYFNF